MRLGPEGPPRQGVSVATFRSLGRAIVIAWILQSDSYIISQFDAPHLVAAVVEVLLITLLLQLEFGAE